MAEGMYHTLRLAFTVKVEELLASSCVFQEVVSSRTSTKGFGRVCLYAGICCFGLAICVDTRRLKLFFL